MPPAYLRGPVLPGGDATAAATLSYRHGCSGKLAQDRRTAQATTRRRGGGSYRCRHCGYWHTTHQDLTETGLTALLQRISVAAEIQ